MSVRIPFDSLMLRAVADELGRQLAGGQVQHIAQPAATDLVLTIRGRGANHALLLSCDADWARAHLTHSKRPNPPSPPAFCMLCRKYIEGARITAIRQRGFDRILDIEFQSAGGVVFTLVAELMGKHSNLILLNEERTILDAAKRITRKLSRLREVLPGKHYLPPPAQKGRADPFDAAKEEVEEFVRYLPADAEAQASCWMAHFAGLSPFLAEELTLRGQADSPERAWLDIFGAAKAGRWNPVIIRNERSETIGAYPFPTVQADAAMQFERDSVNTALDAYVGTALPRAAMDAARHEMVTALARAIKARGKQRESLQRSLEESGRSEEFRQAGELLLANLHRIEPESEFAEVEDYYAPGEGPRRISLDSDKSARENANSYFRRYRKAKDGALVLRQYMERVESDIHTMLEAQATVRDAVDLAAVRAIKADLTRLGLLRGEKGSDEKGRVGPRAPDFAGRKIRVFHTPEGWDVYLGENSEANDYLTSRVASPNDWWLHVRANTSAHVVIRTRNSPSTVPPSVIRRAALLAAQHSASKHSDIVPVDYTLKKFVRRPKGSASGAALYQNEKTIYVNPKEAQKDR